VIWVEFGQRSGSVEVEATYFEALFKASANGLSGTEFQCPRMSS
jgi:hypothetical protein